MPSIYSSARTELAKLLIYGLFRKIRVLAQDDDGVDLTGTLLRNEPSARESLADRFITEVTICISNQRRSMVRVRTDGWIQWEPWNPIRLCYPLPPATKR